MTPSQSSESVLLREFNTKRSLQETAGYELRSMEAQRKHYFRGKEIATPRLLSYHGFDTRTPRRMRGASRASGSATSRRIVLGILSIILSKFVVVGKT